MAWDFARHLASAFHGPGTVAVEYEGEVTQGFLNDEEVMEQDESGGRVYGAGTVLHVLAGCLAGLREPGAATRILVDGAEYRVDLPVRRQAGAAYQMIVLVPVPLGQEAL